MGAAVRKRARLIVDDDDDDIPARVGRPRSPEEFGPPKPDPRQRKEYVARLQAILDAVEIDHLGQAERMYLQRILWRTDRLRDIDPRRFRARGEDQIIPLLRAIFETTNGIAALTLPDHEGSRVVPAL